MRVFCDNIAIKLDEHLTSPGGILLPQQQAKAPPTKTGIIVGIGDGEEIAKHNLFVGQKILIYNAGKGAYPEVPGTENVVIVPEGALLIEMMDEDEMTFAMNEALGIHIDTIAEEHAKPYDPCLNPYGYGKTDTTPPQEDPEK